MSHLMSFMIMRKMINDDNFPPPKKNSKLLLGLAHLIGNCGQAIFPHKMK